MAAVTLIFVATIMALFGVFGYQRGTKFGLLTVGLILAGLVVMSRASDKIGTIVNGLYFGLRFVFSGGVQALGGGDKAEAIKGIMDKIGDAKLVSQGQPGASLLLVLALLVILILLLSAFKVLKGAASLLGLALGLFGGYLVAAYALATFKPELAAFLPLPISIPNLIQAAQIQAAQASLPAIPSDGGLSAKIGELLTDLSNNTGLPIIIAIAIALFVLLATRLGNRGVKKG